MPKIHALDPKVVHKIAAGEIIVSPVNALKELIENSLDAGATNIEVVVKNGGHKLLQVTDNGSGIEEADLEILCQRFTTSKLQKFEDLESIATLGFRGEALASISHIAHLSVKTKTADSHTASIVTYQDGKLVATKRAAGIQGTQITVEDLFYNSSLRSQALHGGTVSSSEYQKILDVVSKYSIQYPGTFSCKRFQDSQPVIISGATQKDKIRKVYGSTTAQSLLKFESEGDISLGLLSVSGWTTGLNYVSKRSTAFIFFINKRLVTFDPLARAIRKVYQDYLPKGNVNPFVFLSLVIKPENVDVNVHPTKRDVLISNDTEIIDHICLQVLTLLNDTTDSRDFRVQSYISSTVTQDFTELPDSNEFVAVDQISHSLPLRTPQRCPTASMTLSVPPHSLPSLRGSSSQGSRPVYEYKLVRTDPQQHKVTEFVSQTMIKDSSPGSPAKKTRIQHKSVDLSFNSPNFEADSADVPNDFDMMMPSSLVGAGNSSHILPSSPVRAQAVHQPPKKFEALDLSSVADLLYEIKNRSHSRLLALFNDLSFIGIADRSRSLAAIQVDVRLLLVQYHNVFREMFYQIILLQLGNFGTVHLGDGLPISELLALDSEATSNDVINFEQLIEMREMLEQYFQISFRKKNDQWLLAQLPVIIPGCTFPIARLSKFITGLATKVNWTEEKNCLRDIARALSTLHLPTADVKVDDVRLLFDTAKTSLVPSFELVPSVMEIANLPGLYKVFERC